VQKATPAVAARCDPACRRVAGGRAGPPFFQEVRPVSNDETRSQDQRDEALKLLPAPVAVIGVRRGDELGGMTAAWLTRVSHEPPLLLVAVGHRRYTRELLESAGAFSVSILADDQPEVARIFGLHSRRERDKWAQVDHVLLSDGVPALGHCAARLLCRIRDRVPLGDHDGIVGEVVSAEIVAGAPALPLRAEDFAT
jgi:flavin reductase (DIM6/NTAB) family NADH-FMN oxidoreductase RutF